MLDTPPAPSAVPLSSADGAPDSRRLGVTPALFWAFRDLAYQQAGIQLREGKEALLATRIARRMRDLGLTDAGDYLARIRADASGDEIIRFLDCISINLTSFYREKKHFSVLAAEAAAQRARAERRFRVWCAAAATGEEPYTIAITLAEAFAGSDVDHRVIATDISTRALAAARLGRYTETQLAPVPEPLRRKYFSPVGKDRPADGARPIPPSAGPLFEVSATLRERVLFNRVNLAKPPWPVGDGLDAILCRNVLIYFDPQIRQRVIRGLEALLRPGGLLMVGQAETLSGLRCSLEPVGPSVYRRPRAA